MDIFQQLTNDLHPEGRYLFLNAIANQLRSPNNHTHYFSCVLLYLFFESHDEAVQEQITRVLVERLIVHRPHPWGLLVTFIELIKNPRYSNIARRGSPHPALWIGEPGSSWPPLIRRPCVCVCRCAQTSGPKISRAVRPRSSAFSRASRARAWPPAARAPCRRS